MGKMVKHNNVIPNIHCKKKYLQSSRGPLKVRLSLNKASKKKSRRLARAAKAAAIAPRPLKLLRPAVQSQTQRYSAKTRLGRGFTLQEIKDAGLTPRYARTIGIAVDHRRINRSVEGLERNVERLKAYMAKLVVFPRRRCAPKKGDAEKSEYSAVADTVTDGVVHPLTPVLPLMEVEDVTQEMKDAKAFTTMRLANVETKVAGYRVAVANRKEKK